jgi:hypothetical protein
MLAGDVESPGANKIYGTNASGVKGWYDQPSGGSGEANTASNLGGGLANFDSKVGVDLRFNTFHPYYFNLDANLISIDTANIARKADLHDPVTLAGQNYLTLSGQQITAGQIDLGSTHVTGTLAAARFGVLTGDVTSAGGTYATTIANDAVTFAKMQNIAQNRIIGRVSAGTGDPEELTGTQVTGLLDVFTASTKGLVPASGGETQKFLRADGTWANPTAGIDIKDDGSFITTALGIDFGTNLNVTDNADGTVTVNSGNTTLTGDVTGSGAGTINTTIANDAVTFAKMQNIAQNRVIGRVSAGAGDPEELTGTQVTGLLDTFTSSAKGLVPAAGSTSTTKFLNAAGLFNEIAANIVLTAGGGWPSTTSGAADPVKVEFATNKQNLWLMDFADGASKLYAEWTVTMPADYNGGTVTAVFYWTVNSTSTNSVVWGIQARAWGDFETIDQPWGTAVEVTDAASGTANQVLVTNSTSAMTIAGTPAANKVVQFRVYRDPANASDTLAATARLISVKLTYTRL